MALDDDFPSAGQLLDAAIRERAWSQRVLALVIGMDETAVNKMVSNKRAISAEEALLLEEALDVSAERFLEAQKRYELAIARITSRKDPQRATRAELFKGIPVPELIKRGWIDVDDIRDVPRVEAELARFFQVQDINQIEVLPHAAKRTVLASEATPSQLAWLYRVRAIASDMVAAKFSDLSARRAVELLRPLTSAAEEARKVPRILAECGIRYVVVEALAGSKIDGACFWLNDRSPVIGMSLRHDRIDNFWFVLRHEIEHVIHQHGKSAVIIDTELEGQKAGTGQDVTEEERIANAAAAEFCVPQKTLDSFIARKAPFFAERDILGVAATLKIHPGLVAGQLQRRTDRYDRFRDHLVKIRSIVAPSAVVDGWGDIAPVGT